MYEGLTHSGREVVIGRRGGKVPSCFAERAAEPFRVHSVAAQQAVQRREIEKLPTVLVAGKPALGDTAPRLDFGLGQPRHLLAEEPERRPEAVEGAQLVLHSASLFLFHS